MLLIPTSHNTSVMLSLMVERPIYRPTMPRPSALTGIARNTVQYNDTIYINTTSYTDHRLYSNATATYVYIV